MFGDGEAPILNVEVCVLNSSSFTRQDDSITPFNLYD